MAKYKEVVRGLDGSVKFKVDIKKEKIQGISGWLGLWAVFEILYLIGLLVAGIYVVFNFEKLDMTNLLFIDILSGVLLFLTLFFNIFVVIDFFQKRKRFIKFVKIFLYGLILSGLFSLRFETAILEVIWLFYFYQSKRVKNTFIN